MRNFEKQRLGHVIKSIYNIYAPYIGQKDKRPKFTSAIAFDKIKGSKSTRVKARKCLGIKAQKIAGTWRWPFPTRTLEQALEYAGRYYIQDKNSNHIKKKIDQAEQQYQIAFAVIKDCMTHYNYEASVEQVNDFCKGHSVYRKGKIFSRIRKELGIVSVHLSSENKDREWHWVWGAVEVQDWLERLLDEVEQALPITQVIDKAREKKWSYQVLLAAKRQLNDEGYTKALGHYSITVIETFKRKDGIWCWCHTLHTHKYAEIKTLDREY